MKVSDRLTDVAELIVQQALDLAWGQIVARHGLPQRSEAGHAAGGRTGRRRLRQVRRLSSWAMAPTSTSCSCTTRPATSRAPPGPAVVENSVFFLRLVQRVVHLLTMHSAAGRLYEVDTRLRPSGKGGLLAQSIAGFEQYQHGEAWTWEHQALLRARAVAGPPVLRAQFEALRVELLRHAVRRDTLREEVRGMRERMRVELSRSRVGDFDLKQDRGGIADIEFLAQYWTLDGSARYAELVTYPDLIRQLEGLASIDLVPQSTVDQLTGAYRAYRQRIHHLSLEQGGAVVPAAEFATERAAVSAVWHATMKS